MPEYETKEISFVNYINWNGVSASYEAIAGGDRWTWSGSGTHTITVHHSDSSSQEIVGNGTITVTRYNGSVYEFYGA